MNELAGNTSGIFAPLLAGALLPFIGLGGILSIDIVTFVVAVGALHLPGEKGLITLLREQGYELKPLPLPFSASQEGGEPEHAGDHKTADAP